MMVLDRLAESLLHQRSRGERDETPSHQGDDVTLNRPIDSPRMSALRHDVAMGDKSALDAFWTDVLRRGAPLIEAGDDESDRLVTFVWRGDAQTHNVVLISEIVQGWWWNGFADSKLFRLEDTDLWHRTYRVRADARFVYRLVPNHSLLHPEDVVDWAAYRAPQQPDPFNPRHFVSPSDDEVPSRVENVWSLVEMPNAPPQPYVTARPGVSAGNLVRHHFHSSTFDKDWRVWVYTPPGYTTDSSSANLLLLFDGWTYTALIPTATILDNLIGEGRIPPIVAVMLDNAADRLRDLNASESFNHFLVDELLPWVRRCYQVTTDPRQTIVGGLSLGGVAAVFAALSHPDVFGNVLAQSGAFGNGRDGEAEEEWLAQEIARRERVPVRFYLEAGLFENQRDVPTTTILRANRHVRTVLQAKGYDVDYSEVSGGHQAICWQGTLSDGLIALVR